MENQATDRAFRIGQDKNVMVHKFICQGTVEEKIDALINSKKELAENVIGSGGESWITEMSNDELLSMLRLEVLSMLRLPIFGKKFRTRSLLSGNWQTCLLSIMKLTRRPPSKTARLLSTPGKKLLFWRIK